MIDNLPIKNAKTWSIAATKLTVIIFSDAVYASLGDAAILDLKQKISPQRRRGRRERPNYFVSFSAGLELKQIKEVFLGCNDSVKLFIVPPLASRRMECRQINASRSLT